MRVSALLESLRRGTAAAVAEAVTWQSTASQLVESMAARHGAYRDVVQPMLLAVSEMKYGLALCEAAAAAQNQGGLNGALPALLSFPASAQHMCVLTALTTIDGVATALAGDTMESRQRKSLDVLLLALRCLDSRSTLSVASWAQHCSVLGRVVDMWTASRASQVEAEAEALAEFRIATRSAAAAAVEAAAADEEAYYRKRFAAGLDPFADLQTAEEKEEAMDAGEKPGPAVVHVPAATASSIFDNAAAACVVGAQWRCVTDALPLPPALALAHDDGTCAKAEESAASDAALHFDPHGSAMFASALRGAAEQFSDTEVNVAACAVDCHSLGTQLLARSHGDSINDVDTAGSSALRLSVECMRLCQSAHAAGASPSPNFLGSDFCDAPRVCPEIRNQYSSAGLSVCMHTPLTIQYYSA